MYDLIIIGSGPAGLSAAVYGKRAGLDLLVMEKSPMSGGQILNTYEVDNYLGMPGAGGFEMGMKFREHADKLGAEFVDAEVLSLEVVAEGSQGTEAGESSQDVEATEGSRGVEAGESSQDVEATEGSRSAGSSQDAKAAESSRGAEVMAAGCTAGHEGVAELMVCGMEGKETNSAGAENPQNGAVGQGTNVQVHTTEGDYAARTVLLATGAGHAHLGVPGEEEFSGRGVSYCATCDGAFFRDKTVAVVGGGDVALEDAIFLSRFCKKVYLIHRRDELRGARILQKELLEKENVEVLYSHRVKEIQGNGQVTGVVLHNLKAGNNQKSGSDQASGSSQKSGNNQTSENVSKSGADKSLALDGVFIAVGIIPHTDLVKDMVECDEKGYVIAGEDCATSVPGIYVAGDARKKPLRQIITAVADGANAVTSIGARLG